MGVPDARAAVSDASTVDLSALPDWADGLRWLFARPVDAAARAELAPAVRRAVLSLMSDVSTEPAAERPAPSANGLGSGLFASFFAAAKRFVEELLQAVPPHVRPVAEPGAYEPMAAALVALLVRGSVGLLRTSPHASGTPTWRELLLTSGDPHRDWLALMEHYPALLRFFGCCARDWCAATTEFVTRLVADVGEVSDAFLDGRLPVLCRVVPGRGDDHAGHRTVTLLVFAADAAVGGQRRVLYKPRSLAPMAAIGTLVDVLEAADVQTLRTPRVLQRDGYGWEEFIAAQAPAGAAEEEQLAARVGAALRLLSVLGSNDATAHNIVVRGSEVVLIDAETQLGCRLAGLADGRSEADAELLTGTAFVTSVSEPHRIGVTGDHGVLAPPAMSAVAGRVDAVLAGFEACQSALVVARDAGLLNNWELLPVRMLLRGTWVYERLLQETCNRGR